MVYSGTVALEGDRRIVLPDRLRYPGVLYLTGDTENVAENDKILFSLAAMPDRYSPVGEARFLSVVGKAGMPGTDVTALVKLHELRDTFPQAVLEQVSSIPLRVEPELAEQELRRGRRDLRSLRIVTIDGADTKDVDDGVSLERLPNGNYRLGVHIADVSYYVRPDSPLDQEAYARGTSVYLVDRVLPMLPQELSNGICSLNVGEDRLAFTVMMEVNPAGEVIRHDIFESLIRVEYKITYEQIYALLEEGEESLLRRYGQYVPDLQLMRELAGVLGEKRRVRGALDFHFDETKVDLDDTGCPVAVYPARLTFANNIIEEFMLLCNETVAEQYNGMKIPFLYRVHEEPDPEKVENLARTVKNMGYSLKLSRGISPKVIQTLLRQVEGRPAETVINTLALRALQKAEYSGENKGHFGLAAEYYTHFTSPIRRYPDLFIHRIMKLVSSGHFPREQEIFYRNILEECAQHCSATEREAASAEEESVELKKVEYMKQFEGEEFEGVISGVTSFGLFVKLPNTVEGLLRYPSLPEYFRFDEERLTATGEHTGRVYHMGDPIRVVTARVDLAMRQIEFTRVEEPENRGKPSGKQSDIKKPARGRKKSVTRPARRR